MIETKDKEKFVTIDKNKISFQIQDGVVSENGVNGIQANDLIEFCYELIKSLNEEFPCTENEKTLQNLYLAMQNQKERTIDRLKRKVEGLNKQ